MPKKLDLAGKVFGKLTVLSDTGVRNKNGGIIWKCQCSCGETSLVRADSLVNGHTTSCGCSLHGLKRERHGLSTDLQGARTATYMVWQNMNKRVKDNRPHVAKNYKNKGITVCERWKSYPNFLADMGEKPADKTLDRVDGSKGYYPENCRWATVWEQGQNKSNGVIHYTEFPCILEKLSQGVTRRELASMYGVQYATMKAVVLRRIPAWLKGNTP